MVGIYKIVSPSGKVYVGLSRDIEKRFGQYKRHECNKQRKVFNSIKKYGADKHEFSTIHELPIDVTDDVLGSYEAFYLDAYISSGHEMLNIKGGGYYGKMAEETKRLIGENSKIHMIGKTPPNKGMTFEEFYGIERAAELKNKMSKSAMGKKISKEALIKRSEFFKKNPHPNKGRKWDEAHCKKLSEAHIGKPNLSKGSKRTEETKNKMRVAKQMYFKKHNGKRPYKIEHPKGEKHHGSKLTECQVIEIYKSNEVMLRLAKKYGVNHKTISNIKSGKNWSHITKQLVA